MAVKMPPIEKIHEAYSAIADGRITMRESEADVVSSDLSKTYLVKWNKETYSSNDNASYWKGYLGYPLIAVLMLQGKLPLDEETAAHFKGINWKKRNTAHKNKFAEAVKELMDEWKESGIDCAKINEEIDRVYKEIEKLTVTTKRSSLRPPQ